MSERARLYDATGHDRAVDAHEVGRPAKRQILWVDVTGEPETDDLDERLGLGGLLDRDVDAALTGLWRTETAVRVRIAGITRTNADAGAIVPRVAPVDIVLAPDVVVSRHDHEIAGLTDAVDVYEGESALGALDAIGFAGMLLDGVVGAYFRSVEAVEEEIDRVDQDALKGQDPRASLPALVAIRARITGLRRALAPQREVFAAMARPDFQLQSELGTPWPGLADRVERAIDAVENARELLVGSFDIVMSQIDQHTNDVVRLLTVISSVLLPSVVIAGVMGMNFKVGIFDEPANFFVVIGAMVLLAVAILLFARSRRWI